MEQRTIRVYLANAFTRNNQGGNPAGVVLDTDGLSREDKQSIASRLGFSETAFIHAGEDTDFYLEYFTPNKQLENCGHATVASFGVMLDRGLLQKTSYTFRTLNQRNEVVIEDGKIRMTQGYSGIREFSDPRVLTSLGLESGDLLAPVMISDTGNRFIQVLFRDAADLARLQPDFELIHEVSELTDAVGYYVTAFHAPHIAYARMFAPRYAIPEESATGIGAGAFTAYLFAQNLFPADGLQVWQGDFMDNPSPSLLETSVVAPGGLLARVQVEGRVNILQQRDITV